MTGFWESNCQDYLDNINFNYMSIDDYNINILKDVYIDIYGRKHITPPKGLSIMNKTKYIRL